MSAGLRGVNIHDLRDGSNLASFSTPDGVDCAALAPDGRAVAAVSRDAKARLWDIATGELRFERSFERAQYGIAFAPDGATLAIVGSAGAALHDATTGELRVPLEGHSGRLRAVDFDPTGATLATAGSDGTVRVWRAVDGELLATEHAHDQGVIALAFSPDGTRLATAGSDDRMRLWDTATCEPVLTLDAKEMYCVSWSRRGDRLWVVPLASRAFCLSR
jgi:WD40 repeat protein